MTLVAYLPTVSLLGFRLLATGGASIEMDWVIGALVLGFITQTLVGWNRLTAMERDLKGVGDDIAELIDLHPRTDNPGEGHMTHDPSQFCPNKKCLVHPPGWHAKGVGDE